MGEKVVLEGRKIVAPPQASEEVSKSRRSNEQIQELAPWSSSTAALGTAKDFATAVERAKRSCLMARGVFQQCTIYRESTPNQTINGRAVNQADRDVLNNLTCEKLIFQQQDPIPAPPSQ